MTLNLIKNVYSLFPLLPPFQMDSFVSTYLIIILYKNDGRHQLERHKGYQMETDTSTIVHPKPNTITNSEPFHVKWVPCHHGMARPQVADGEDGLQMYWVEANTLNKHSWTADKVWSSNLGVRLGANDSSLEKKRLLRNVTQRIGLGWILWNDETRAKQILYLTHGM
jgi:hypothetical protein